MDLDLDVMHDDVRVDEENLGFVQCLGFITVSEILDVLGRPLNEKKNRFEEIDLLKSI